jgi:superfamily I DNA and/or RNA helicase
MSDGYINFAFGSEKNERTQEIAKKLNKKIDDLLEQFDLSKDEFFDEILPHIVGVYVSSPNMDRRIRETSNFNGNTSRTIYNFFFRLALDSFASQGLNNNTTIMLKGDLRIFVNERDNQVNIKDFYLVPSTEKLDYEIYLSCSVGKPVKSYPSGNNLINLDLAKPENVPFTVDCTKFTDFINKWKKHLEFEKSITLGTIKSCPVIGKIEFQDVLPLDDNAANREDYDDYIVKESRGKIFVSTKSPKLNTEKSINLLSISVDGKNFGDSKEQIIKKARSFVRMGLSLLDGRENNNLNLLMTELNKNYKDREKLPSVRGFDFGDWIMPEYEDETGKLIFYFPVDEEDYKDKNADILKKAKSAANNYTENSKKKKEKASSEDTDTQKEAQENFYLAYMAAGDIILYDRGRDALNKLETGDVKNPYLAGLLIDPAKFDSSLELFSKDTIRFALKDLNESQEDAIIKCLNTNGIFTLQGPPGTGKTQTITEIVYQFNKIGKKVLLSSQTHIAIDNVFERLPKELNILPIRLVRERNKANKQYLPDKILDNFYDAAYHKYNGKIQAYKKFEKELEMLKRLFDNNKAQYENIKKRLEKAKKLEDDNNNIIKELSALRAEENENESELDKIKRSLLIFEEFYRTKLPFEKVLNEYNYTPLTEQFAGFAKKYRIQEQDDLYNYAVAFKRIAGVSRRKHLTDLLSGGEKPQELSQIEEAIENLRGEIDTFEKYNNAPLEELIKKRNAALQEKKNLDRKYESSGVQIFDFSNEKFNFAEATPKSEKEVIQEELSKIKEFVGEYEEILSRVLSEEEFNKLNDRKDEMEAKLNSINNEIKRTTVASKNTRAEIDETNVPIKEEREKLENYFNEFYTDKLNGASRPKTEEAQFKEIEDFIEKEKSNFAQYKLDFLKLQPIYESLVKYLGNRENFIASHRGIYTDEFLKRNANVYGMTCTSSPYFKSSHLIGDEENSQIEVKDIDIRHIDFDVVIIDEVSKATPIEMLIPIICGKKVILVGDQRQLPPIFKYRENMFEGKTEEEETDMLQGESLEYFKKNVESSLFEEIYNKLKTNRAMLTAQYRFNSAIMNCVNVFYDGRLSIGGGEDQDNKKKHYLDASIKNPRGGMTHIFCQKNSTYWFDSDEWSDNITRAYSEVYEGETSLRNELEVKITVELLLLLEKRYGDLKKNNFEDYRKASSDGKKPSVAVLSMYGKQIDSIRTELKKRNSDYKCSENISVDISTVDNYQGKEQDIILVNMVANTKKVKPSEFLTKFNRINVAISRARTMLIMVGSKNYYNRVKVNVPNIDTGEDNFINAYYQIFEKCESRWVSAAGVLGIKKENNDEKPR